MPDIHCPSCQAAIPFPEGSRQITCPVCRHSFDPLYPFGRPMSQGAQAPEPPRQGFGELRYPGPVGPQPQYPRTPAPPRQYAPSQYPGPPNLPLEQRKRGMPTWATVLLIVVPVVGLLVAAVWYTDYKDSQPPELADKESWYHYYSDDGDFTLLFPDKPIESTGISHSAVGDITTYRAESANLSSDYFVGWWDLPPGSTFDLMSGVRVTVDGTGRSLLSGYSAGSRASR